ncbi:MAG: lipid II:glycine glycyltransferase FemX [Planctomycetaceae bacterium]
MIASAKRLHAACALRVVGPADTPTWDEYVAIHPQGTVFHTSAMIDVYASVPQYEPFAVAAENAAGEIVAMLVAVRIETVSGIASSLASRSIFHAEPICNDDEEGIEGLVMLLRLHDRHMKSRTVFSEVRPIGASGAERVALEKCGYEFKDYLNYVVDLTQDVDMLWGNLSRSCRQSVSRCRRKDVVIRDATTDEGVRQMYGLIKSSYQRARVPLGDIRLFHAALERLPKGTVQIRIASHQGAAVAGGVVLVFKGRMYAWYGGTTRPPGITPFDGFTWDEIQWGSRNHQQTYDFGGAGWPDEDYGPRKFKAKFGGRLVNYGRYLKIYSGWKMAVAKTSFRVLRSVVSTK